MIVWCVISSHAALINWLELINKSLKCGWTVRDDWQLQQGFVVFLTHRAAASLLLSQRGWLSNSECLINIFCLFLCGVKVYLHSRKSALLMYLTESKNHLQIRQNKEFYPHEVHITKTFTSPPPPSSGAFELSSSSLSVNELDKPSEPVLKMLSGLLIYNFLRSLHHSPVRRRRKIMLAETSIFTFRSRGGIRLSVCHYSAGVLGRATVACFSLSEKHHVSKSVVEMTNRAAQVSLTSKIVKEALQRAHPPFRLGKTPQNWDQFQSI